MANMCVTQEGYKEAEAARFDALRNAALIKQAVATLQFALNASDAIKNFKKLRNVSSRGVSIEEQQQGHLKNTYWPAEVQMLEEFTQSTPWETQVVLSRRYAGRMWAPLAVGFAREIRKMECEKPRYCGNAFVKNMQDLMVRRSGTLGAVKLMADRIAYYEIQAVLETDFTRRQQVIAMRQGLVQQAATLMGMAANGFAGANANALAAVNNAITTFGHAMGERQAAEDRRGTDPYFHSQISREASRGSDVPVVTMAPTSYANQPVDLSGTNDPHWNGSVTANEQSSAVPETSGVVVFPLGEESPNLSQTFDLSEAQ